MTNTKIAKEDYKFVPADPEPGFSPEHNKRVIEGTIAKYEKMRAAKENEFKKGLAERTDALATYVTSMKNTKPADRYFGKRWMAYLRGDYIRNKIMDNVLQTDTDRLYEDIKRENLKSK